VSELDIAILGAAKLDEHSAELWQTIVAVTDAENDVENLGECQVYQALGVTSLPYPKDSRGYAEALIVRNAGGRSCVAVGARDTRSKVAAGLAQGDVCLHATGPEEAAQVRCLEKKRTVVAITRDSAGDSMAVILDGKRDTIQIIGRGAVIEIAKNGDINLTGRSAGIMIQGGDIILNGTVRLAGMAPGMVLMQGPPSGSPGGPASVPLMPVLGVGK
jgi:hypothetical protein